MSKEITILLPHALSREEARLRVAAALERARAGVLESLVAGDVAWTGDKAEVSIGLLGQNVTGEIEVEDAQVRVRILLPWLLERFSGPIADKIARMGESHLRLERPAPPVAGA
jgi:hypothetical protein